MQSIAEQHNHDVRRLSFDLTTPAAFDGDAWLIQSHDLAEQDALIVRQYPAIGAQIPGTTDLHKKQIDQLERSHFAQSLLFDLERRGIPIVNPLLASGPFDLKPFQLAAFARAGFPIPRTMITNFTPAVEAFANDAGDVVVKPIAGGAEARLLSELHPAALKTLGASPVIFQQRIRGADVRVTVVGQQIAAAVEIPSDTLDYRSGSAYKAGDQRYVEHSLPNDATNLCLRVAKLCNHVLSGIDLKHTPEGDYVLIEANSAPVYLDIELKTGAPISERIIEWLEGAAA